MVIFAIFMLHKWCVKILYSELRVLTIKIWGGSIIDAIQVDQDFYGTNNPNPTNLNQETLYWDEQVSEIKYAKYIGSVTSLSQFLCIEQIKTPKMNRMDSFWNEQCSARYSKAANIMVNYANCLSKLNIFNIQCHIDYLDLTQQRVMAVGMTLPKFPYRVLRVNPIPNF